MFAMFVCIYRGAFPPQLLPHLFSFLTLHTLQTYLYLYNNILKSFDNPVYDSAVNSLHTFV